MDLTTIQTRPRLRRLSLFRLLSLALTLRRQRRHLGELDRRLLRDIGLTEAEAGIEARKSFWDVPQHWLR
mgnify:CR=1 FL=1